jgi:hypothetical protein
MVAPTSIGGTQEQDRLGSNLRKLLIRDGSRASRLTEEDIRLLCLILSDFQEVLLEAGHYCGPPWMDFDREPLRENSPERLSALCAA